MKEISPHELKVFLTVRQHAPQWITNRDIAAKASISERTVRKHTANFVKCGLMEVAQVYPNYRYRFLASGVKENRAYVALLDQACTLFETKNR